VVSVKEQSRKLEIVNAGLRRRSSREPVPYVQVHEHDYEGRLTTIPGRDQVPIPIREDLVVEYYSKYL
jgi:small subunit ribosomal protein S4